jgi:hypothetical protein
MKKGKKEGVETLEYAVYGGICGILGLLSILILLFAVLECRPAVINAIGRSIVSASLAILSIHFGKKSDTKEGKIVVLIGIIILILVVISYIFGIIPCASS